MLCLQSHHFSSLFSLNFYLEKPQEKSEEEKSEERREQKEKPHFRATFLFGGELGIRTLGEFPHTAFRVLWVNGCLVIFEGGFGQLCICRKA